MKKVVEFPDPSDSSVADRPSRSGAHIDLSVGGMTCRHCPPMVEKALEEIDGVKAAQVNLSSGTAAIDYDPGQASIGDLAKAIRSAGYSAGTAKTRLLIKNMHCSSCVTRIELALRMTPGVVSARANLGPNAVDVEYQPEVVDFAAIRRAIESAGHKIAEPKAAEIKAAVEEDTDPEEAARNQEYRTPDAQVLVRRDRFGPGDGAELSGPDPWPS